MEGKFRLDIPKGTHVLIVLGSPNDKGKVKESKLIKIFEACGIRYHTSVISAHRNLVELWDACEEMMAVGVEVVIGMAGMNAALPGIIGAMTGGTLPILGVPLPSDAHPDAADALSAMINNPSGTAVMVSGVCTPGMENSAFAAAMILGMKYPEIKAKLMAYRRTLAESKPAQGNVSRSELTSEPDPTSAG